MPTIDVLTSAPQASIDMGVDGDTFVFTPMAQYDITTPLVFSELDDFVILGNEAVIKRVAEDPPLPEDTMLDGGCVLFDRCTNGVVKRLWTDGNRQNRTENEHRSNANVYLLGGDNLEFKGCREYNACTDGIYAYTSDINDRYASVSRLKLRSSYVQDAYRNGIAFVAARKVTGTGIVIKRTSGTEPKAGIDIESSELNATHANEMICLRDTLTEDCIGNGIDIINKAGPQDMVIERFRSRRCARGAVYVSGQRVNVYDVDVELTAPASNARAVLDVATFSSVENNRLWGWTISGDPTGWTLTDLPSQYINSQETRPSL